MPTKFTPEQQQFLDGLVVDIAHKISEFLYQRGIGPPAPPAPPRAPNVAIPGGLPAGVPQTYEVIHRKLDGSFTRELKSVPQLLAEMNDKLEVLLYLLNEDDEPRRRESRSRRHEI